MTAVLKPGSNCLGVYDADRTGLLIDACDYYRAFYQTALKARSYLLLAGWQFDSEVRLLRGEDEAKAKGEIRFLRFLEVLCDRNPQLVIYILAWDFSAVFSLEREWFQEIIFNWTTNERIHFRFDSVHASGATHHQKFVVADGAIAYAGGMDICSSRWDDRRHLIENPERVDVDGTRYGSYHDIQSYHTGEVVKVLLDLFHERWLASGGAGLKLPRGGALKPQLPAQAFALPASRVAVSLTQAPTPRGGEKVQQIRHLFVDAIMAADSLIYLESQYFSSQAIYWALVARMTSPDRPRLRIVMLLPDRLPLTEELFLGLPQMKMIRSLERVAERTGHTLNVYSSVEMDHGNRKMTFIHSKLLIVDDRFLSVGSANATNRSMGLDTELNVSWEASPGEDAALVAAIRRLRASLLAEHSGLYGQNEEWRFEAVETLTGHLACLADDHQARLCRYQPDPALEQSDWPDALEPIARVVDPDKPVDNEYIFESLSKSELGSFAKGIFKLSQMIIGL